MGTSAVVSATSQWMPWITELFGNVLVVEALSPQLLSEASMRASRDSYRLHGPYHYSVTTSADWQSREAPPGYTVEIGGGELLQSLVPADWPNAISPRASTQGRHVAVAAIAIRAGAAVGVATATEDSDALQQIGIDVQQEHRGRGSAQRLPPK